jgi:transcriptional regulator with XRE-family HTH domain
MRRENAAVQATDEEVKRLLALLDSLVRLSKRSQRELEREYGFGNGVLSKILSGRINPKLQHALLIAKGIGLTPAEFFAIAYPDRPKRLEEIPLVALLHGAEGRPREEKPGDELDERILAAIERALKERASRP